MEATCSSEISVDFQPTMLRYIPCVNLHLHTCFRRNLSHKYTRIHSIDQSLRFKVTMAFMMYIYFSTLSVAQTVQNRIVERLLKWQGCGRNLSGHESIHYSEIFLERQRLRDWETERPRIEKWSQNLPNTKQDFYPSDRDIQHGESVDDYDDVDCNVTGKIPTVRTSIYLSIYLSICLSFYGSAAIYWTLAAFSLFLFLHSR
jgi:hypothetical protein